MPVEDINGAELGVKMVESVFVAEDVSELWLNNAPVVAWFFLFAVFIGILLFIVFFLKAGLVNILTNKR